MTTLPKGTSIWTRHDGTKVPMFGNYHRAAIKRAAEEPEMQTTHKGELFKRLLRGNEILSEQDIRELRHSARFPYFVSSLQKALAQVADVHEAARVLNNKSPAQLDQEIAVVVGKPTSKSKKRR